MDFVKNLDERFKLQNLGIDKETLRKYHTFISFHRSSSSYLSLLFDFISRAILGHDKVFFILCANYATQNNNKLKSYLL